MRNRWDFGCISILWVLFHIFETMMRWFPPIEPIGKVSCPDKCLHNCRAVRVIFVHGDAVADFAASCLSVDFGGLAIGTDAAQKPPERFIRTMPGIERTALHPRPCARRTGLSPLADDACNRISLTRNRLYPKEQTMKFVPRPTPPKRHPRPNRGQGAAKNRE